MATRIIWGYINSDGTITSGTSDFNVNKEPNTSGMYDVNFNPNSFNNTPAIVGSCVATSSEAPVFQIYSLNSDATSGFIAETRDAHSGDRDDRTFMFTATGTVDDSTDDDVLLNTNDVNTLITNSGSGY